MRLAYKVRNEWTTCFVVLHRKAGFFYWLFRRWYPITQAQCPSWIGPATDCPMYFKTRADAAAEIRILEEGQGPSQGLASAHY